MTFAITRAAMEAVHGPGRLVTVPAERLNPTVTNPAAAEFLTTVGLPDVPGFLYLPLDAPESGLPAISSAVPEIDEIEDLPPSTDRWVYLGGCWSDDVLVLDGASGTVLGWVDGEEAPRFANTGVDLFALFITAFYRDGDALGAPDMGQRQAAVDDLLVELREADPAGLSDPEGYWYLIADRFVRPF